MTYRHNVTWLLLWCVWHDLSRCVTLVWCATLMCDTWVSHITHESCHTWLILMRHTCVTHVPSARDDSYTTPAPESHRIHEDASCHISKQLRSHMRISHTSQLRSHMRISHTSQLCHTCESVTRQSNLDHTCESVTSHNFATHVNKSTHYCNTLQHAATHSHLTTLPHMWISHISQLCHTYWPVVSRDFALTCGTTHFWLAKVSSIWSIESNLTCGTTHYWLWLRSLSHLTLTLLSVTLTFALYLFWHWLCSLSDLDFALFDFDSALYGVATISRLLKSQGLFCKRAL